MVTITFSVSRSSLTSSISPDRDYFGACNQPVGLGCPIVNTVLSAFEERPSDR